MIRAVILALGATAALAGCNPTPQQQAAIQCGVATGAGTAVGAGLGSAVGGGSGRNIAMAAGAVGGAAVGSQMAC